MLEYHDVIKKDPSNPEDKQLIETYLTSRYSAEKLTLDGLLLKE